MFTRAKQRRVSLKEDCPSVHITARDKTPNTLSSRVYDLLKAQLDDNIDRFIPFGRCGSYGATFKPTGPLCGFTVVGKGTTTGL
jgi:hypothetical protein